MISKCLVPLALFNASSDQRSISLTRSEGFPGLQSFLCNHLGDIHQHVNGVGDTRMVDREWSTLKCGLRLTL
jgi:hypothetical protein